MQELEEVLRGKPETQFSPAEEPRWDEVRDRCVELLRRSKNLRVALILCLAALRMQGIPGFRDGLTLIRGFFIQYWESVYPRLDPDDNNDPTERMNILAAMLTPLGAFEDPMQFLRRLREAKLSDSPQVGRFSYEDLFPSGTANADGSPLPDSAQVQASFRDTSPEKLQNVMTAVMQSIEFSKETDDFLTRMIGAGRAPDWGALMTTLNEIRKALAPFLGQSVEESVAADGTVTGGVSGSIPGTIQSRQDVVRALDQLCDYYTRAEPSSPVPLLLRRAQRLADMTFLEIIGDLSPEALAPVQHVTGVKPAES